MNNASSNTLRPSSTPAAESALRPRTKRLISGLSEAGDATAGEASTPARRASPIPSPFVSRDASPAPLAHLSRPPSRDSKYAGNSWGRRAQLGTQRKAGNETPNSIAGLWGSSWSTLQGLANDFLGNELDSGSVKDKDTRQHRSLSRLQGQRATSANATPNQWGPGTPTSHPTQKDVAVGSREESENALRAQKRKDMLLRQESSYADTLGKFKRRLSDDYESATSAPPGGDEDRAALVYLHHVKKNDTLAGITIRYNCSANVLRKANRMWPNDTIQSRQTIVLPVDSCGSKGKPISDAEAQDLLTSENDALSTGQAEEVRSSTNSEASKQPTHSRTNSNTTSTGRSRAQSNALSSNGDSEPPWHHISWSILPNSSHPTEIARLSRRNLGYFPRARRKTSLSLSDTSTPQHSLDLVRTDTSQRPRRARRPSNAQGGYFPSYLAGPGGVGTMARSVNCPGPAQDGLNRVFARHLPDVAPPKNQTDLYQPEMPHYSDDAGATPAASGTGTPTFSARGNPNLNVNLENVGGAIEGWVRRMATKAQTGLTPTERGGAGALRTPISGGGGGVGGGVGIGGPSGIGDLIEMTDEFEIGGDEEDEDEGRGRVRGMSTTGADYFGGAAVKGRGKSGKAD